jgi:hypothetical protein
MKMGRTVKIGRESFLSRLCPDSTYLLIGYTRVAVSSWTLEMVQWGVKLRLLFGYTVMRRRAGSGSDLGTSTEMYRVSG